VPVHAGTSPVTHYWSIQMNRLVLAALAATIAAPAFAEPSCTMGETRAPIWQSIKAFEEEGGVVVSFKINDGNCYEIYGKLDETNMEVFFDPNTGAELDRIPA
jgi:hypothetical protein